MKKLDIKRALSEHNMSQVELARRTGVNAPNISAIIKDGNPTIARLTKIAEGIGCDITDLFYLDPTEEAEAKEKRDREMEQEREKALENAKSVKGKPTAIIMKTVKGKGVSFMENKVNWHGSAPNKEQYDEAMAELNAAAAAIDAE